MSKVNPRKTTKGWKIRHRIQDIAFRVGVWAMQLINGTLIYCIIFDKFALQQHRKLQTFRKYLSRHFPLLGEVVRVNSIKMANEVRFHTGSLVRVIDLLLTHTRNLNAMQTNRFSHFLLYAYAANEST